MDGLKLGENPVVQKLLLQKGSTFPKPETVLFSAEVRKNNKRGKWQDRVLMITDKAMYNLLPKDLSLKRRVPLEHMAAMTASKKSHEFVVHIPEEYDYRFESDKQSEIREVLSTAFAAHVKLTDKVKELQQDRLPTTWTEEETLEKRDLTKELSSHMSAEERKKRREHLAHEGIAEEERVSRLGVSEKQAMERQRRGSTMKARNPSDVPHCFTVKNDIDHEFDSDDDADG